MSEQAQSGFDEVMAPVNRARGLPNEHYVCETMFQQEKRDVLFANWSGIGFAKDVPETGDALPVKFLGMPLLVVRDKDGSIGVFQNTCRHRGMILVEKPTRIGGAIRCPYHSWCYALNGDLRSTPHVGGPGHNTHQDIKRDQLGLIKIRSHVWRDIIFVNISGTAAEFAEYAAELIDRWKEFDQPMHSGGTTSSFQLEVKSNWKLCVENYCESYHLPWVHPGLNSYSRLEDHYNIEKPLAFSGQGTLVYRQLQGENGAKFPDFPALPEKWNEGAEYIALYPNVLFGVHRDHAYAIILEPVAVDKTREHIEIYYPDAERTMQGAEELKQTNCNLWKAIFEEDIFVVEGMQMGRHGQLFDGGKFSPVMDGPTHNFHHWVANQLSHPHKSA